MNNLYITDHSERRFKERTGLPKRLVTAKAREALERGITHAETTGQLRRYYDKLYLANKTANNIRTYHNYVYIFCYDALVTMFPLPQSLRKTAIKIWRKKQIDTGNTY
jgi:hypothetical protein